MFQIVILLFIIFAFLHLKEMLKLIDYLGGGGGILGV